LGDLTTVHVLRSAHTMVFTQSVPHGIFTVYEALVSETDPFFFLDTRSIFVPGATNWIDPKIKEIPAGMGGIGLGCMMAHGTIIAAIDFSPLACELLRKNQHGLVLCGDLLMMRQKANYTFLVAKVQLWWQDFPVSCIVSRGSNVDQPILDTVCSRRFCAPHTCTWFNDSFLNAPHSWNLLRSSWDGLFMTSRSHSAINGLVAGIDGGSCFALPSGEPRQCKLGPLPRDSRRLIPSCRAWVLWSHAREQQLPLCIKERLFYSDSTCGDDKRILGMKDLAATFLHSYGSAVEKCPCGCRDSLFSEHVLREKSLRACIVVTRSHRQPRYLHAMELFALHLTHGVPCSRSPGCTMSPGTDGFPTASSICFLLSQFIGDVVR